MTIQSHWYKEARTLISECLELFREANLLEHQVGKDREIARLLERGSALIPEIEEKLGGERDNLNWAGNLYGERDYKGNYVYDNDGLDTALKSCQRELGKLSVAEDCGVGEERFVRQWRTIIEEHIENITQELGRRGIRVQAAPAKETDPDDVREVIRKRIQTERELLQDCEEEVRQHPEDEAHIRRIYGKAIHRLKEQL